MRKISEVQYINTDGIKKDKLFFISSGTNILYTLSIKDLVIEKVTVLGRKSNSWAVLLYGENIYCCALDDCSVYKLDNNGKIINEFIYQKETGYMLDAYIYMNTIVFIPWNIGDNILFFNISKLEFETDDYWMTMHNKIEMTGNAYIWNRFDNVLSYVVDKRDRVIVYDLKRGKCFQLHNPTNRRIRDCVCVDDMLYMLIEEERDLYVYNMDHERLSVINTGEQSEHKKLIAYKRNLFIVCSEKVLFFENDRVLQTDIKVDCYNGSSFVNILAFENKVLFLPWAGSTFAVFDPDSKEVQIHELKLPLHDVVTMKPIITEVELSLSDYLLGIEQ